MEKSMRAQTQTEWEEEMSLKILRLVHDELYVELRYMGIALSALTPKPDRRLSTIATDGTSLFFLRNSFCAFLKRILRILTGCIFIQCCTVFFLIFGFPERGIRFSGGLPATSR